MGSRVLEKAPGSGCILEKAQWSGAVRLPRQSVWQEVRAAGQWGSGQRSSVTLSESVCSHQMDELIVRCMDYVSKK